MPEPLKLTGNRVTPQGSSTSIHVPQPTLARAPDLYDRSLSVSLHALTHGMEQLSEGVRRSNEQDAAAWSSKALSQARLDWTKTFLQRKEQAEAASDGTSFEDFTPKLLEDFDKYAEETVGKAPTNTSRTYLTERFAALRGELGTHALTFEAQARIDARTDNITTAIRNRGQLLALDPGQFQTAVAEQRAEIEGSPIPPIQKSKLLDAAILTLSKNAVSSQIQKSPTGFLQSVGFIEGPDTQGKLRRTSGDLNQVTGNKAFDLLPFDERMKAIDIAIKAKNSIDSDADKAAEKMRKTLGDNAMKDGWDLWSKGKLSLEFISSIKPLVHENDYKSLMTAFFAGNAAQRTDRDTLSNIYRLIDANKFDQAKRAVYSAHQNGLMKNEGSDGLTGMLAHIASLEKHDGPKTQYERSRQYITLSMDPGMGVYDPTGRSRLAEAVRDFDQWMTTAPKDKVRADDAIDARAREIVGSYKLIDFRDSVLMLPQPRGTKIDRQHVDFDKMEGQIKSAVTTIVDNKQFTDAEKNIELAKLKRWKDAMEAARGFAKQQR